MNVGEIRRTLRDTTMESALMQALADGGQASFRDVASAVGGESAASVAVERLIGMGLVERERSMAAEVTLSLEGHRAGEAIRESRLTGPDRRAAVQRGLLRWLASGERPGEVGEFVGHKDASSAQVAFSEEEVRLAADALLGWDLITCIRTSSPHLLRPQITHEGREAADDHRTPREFVKAGGGSTTYDHSSSVSVTGGSNVAVQAGGQDNVLIATQTASTDTRIQVMAKATELLGLLGGDGDPAVRAAIEAVRDEAASPEPTVTSLKGKALDAMVAAVGAGAGHQIVEGLAQLAQMIN